MIKWLLRNTRTFLLALALALIVWISAVTAADPDEVREYPQQIPLQVIGQDPGLVIVGQVPAQISVTLRAPRSVWNQLLATTGEVKAVLDLSGLDVGDHQLRLQVQVGLHPVQIVSLSPPSVTIRLEKLATVSLPVSLSLRGEPAVGYSAGTPQVVPNTITISGPQSLVSSAALARVELSIAGLRQDVQNTLQVHFLDSAGNTITGLTSSPDAVRVDLPITQQGGYRDIAVKVNVRGQQAGGYRVTNISVFPPVVTVYSQNPAVVNDLPGYIETEPLNLNGESENIDTHLKLALASGISIVGDQTVHVQVDIAPIEGSISLVGIPVEVIGLTPGLYASISPPLVDVILTGPLPFLDKLTPDAVKFVVDLTGMEIGIHQVIPQAQITNPDIRLQSLNPGTIEVVISYLKPGTPGPTVTLSATPTVRAAP